MFSLKIYQTCIRQNFRADFMNRTYLLSRNYKVFINSLRGFKRDSKSVHRTSISKFVIFALSGTALTFTSCAIWEYEAKKAALKRGKSLFTNLYMQIFGRPPKSQDIYWVIAGINSLVFIMFNIRTKHLGFLSKFPLCIESKPSALLLSMFTHIKLWHILINMYVLHSFVPLMNYFGAPQFIAIYISGGLMCGVGSIIFKNLRNIRIQSVGASGAILTVIGMFATAFPNARLGIPIISDITNFTFSAKSGIIGLIIFDLCGLLLFRRSILDHAGHLCGTAFGVLYGLLGKNLLWDSRRYWMSWYYDFRS